MDWTSSDTEVAERHLSPAAVEARLATAARKLKSLISDKERVAGNHRRDWSRIFDETVPDADSDEIGEAIF